MKILWKGRKRLLFFGLPWTFTKYTIMDDKVIVDSGLLTSNQDEVRLYRIVDISMKRTLMQKIFGLGTIICNTVDKTSPTLEFVNIKSPLEIKELLSESVEQERIRKRVASREYMHSDIDDDNDDNEDYYDHYDNN